MSSSDAEGQSDPTLSQDAIALAERIAAAANEPDSLSDEALGRLFAATVRLYAARQQDGRRLHPFGADGHGVTATEAMISTTAILQAVNLQLFELGMWQAWTGAQAMPFE